MSTLKREDVTVRYERPPMYAEISARFPVKPGVVFTWGATIFDPTGGHEWPSTGPSAYHHLPVDLMEHEVVHANQQGNDPEAWWQRYLLDDSWRLSQEVPAYQRQYRVIKTFTADRNELLRRLMKLAGDLSSPLYGSIISHDEAMRTISA